MERKRGIMASGKLEEFSGFSGTKPTAWAAAGVD
jgi:hypothetical protein